MHENGDHARTLDRYDYYRGPKALAFHGVENVREALPQAQRRADRGPAEPRGREDRVAELRKEQLAAGRRSWPSTVLKT